MQNLGKYKLVISPMAGVTDAPFRKLALNHGADYGVMEMITSQTHLWDNDKTQWRLKADFIENPKIIQIAGASSDVIAAAAKACLTHQPTAIEINMGCPAKKVCNVLAGSALLKDELLVAQILQSAVAAVDVPIYLKTRLGWNQDNKNILKIAQIAEDSGIKSLAIHGRTREDMYNGSASFDLIAEVKAQAKIPVFANGDITSPQKAYEVLQYTQVDGLYIGRGALGQPWLFQNIRDYCSGRDINNYSREQIINIMLNHISDIHQHYGEFMGVRIARKHVKWYLYANEDILGDAQQKFADFAVLTSPNEQLIMIENWLLPY